MPPLWDGTTWGRRRKVFHHQQLTQTFQNSRRSDLSTFKRPRSYCPKMRKVQLKTGNGTQTHEDRRCHRIRGLFCPDGTETTRPYRVLHTADATKQQPNHPVQKDLWGNPFKH